MSVNEIKKAFSNQFEKAFLVSESFLKLVAIA
ncbi:MAG: hypothetical protein ACI94C_000323, partial [Sediminicola sp.]